MCTECIQVQHQQKSIPVKVKRTSKPFEMVNFKVCGPFCIRTIGGHKHFVLFIHNYTPFTVVWMVSAKKLETNTTTYTAIQAAVTALGYESSRFWCDNGRHDYYNKTLRSVLTTSITTY
jgi:hypothetical protein